MSELKVSKELKAKKEYQINVNDNAIDEVAKKIAEKTGISIDKARTELGIGIILGMMMNKHRMQDISEHKK